MPRYGRATYGHRLNSGGAAPTPGGGFIIVSVSTGRSLTTADGVWTFSGISQVPSNLLLDGTPVDANTYAMIAVGSDNYLYALRDDTTWWYYDAGSWVSSGEPP